ncbi:hypothetical protein AcW1_008525 [Taiwanofungus camphoratus]|nr:hypothetical protein AcW1_008525 [Antrodia cinnamomea]
MRWAVATFHLWMQELVDSSKQRRISLDCMTVHGLLAHLPGLTSRSSPILSLGPGMLAKAFQPARPTSEHPFCPATSSMGRTLWTSFAPLLITYDVEVTVSSIVDT